MDFQWPKCSLEAFGSSKMGCGASAKPKAEAPTPAAPAEAPEAKVGAKMGRDF